MRSECSTAGVPVGGKGSACPWAGLWVLMAFVAVGLLPPAFSLCPHAPPGKKTWWNANAGVAIVTIINAETNTAAKSFFTLLNETSFHFDFLSSSTTFTHVQHRRFTGVRYSMRKAGTTVGRTCAGMSRPALGPRPTVR